MAHPLHTPWVLWCLDERPVKGRRARPQGGWWASHLTEVAEFNTVEGFWAAFSHVLRPETDAPKTSRLMLFRKDVKPAWEDPVNKNGARLVLHLPFHLLTVAWQEVCLALVGEQLDGCEEISGCMLAFRSDERRCVLQLWSQNKSGPAIAARQKRALQTLLRVPDSVSIEYSLLSSNPAPSSGGGDDASGAPASDGADGSAAAGGPATGAATGSGSDAHRIARSVSEASVTPSSKAGWLTASTPSHAATPSSNVGSHGAGDDAFDGLSRSATTGQVSSAQRNAWGRPGGALAVLTTATPTAAGTPSSASAAPGAHSSSVTGTRYTPASNASRSGGGYAPPGARSTSSGAPPGGRAMPPGMRTSAASNVSDDEWQTVSRK